MSNVAKIDLYLRDIESDIVTLTVYKDDGTIQDLTGWSASAKVRLARSTTGVVLTLTSSPGIIITAGAVEGNCQVLWTVASKTTIRAALVDSVGAWGLSLTDSLGVVHVVAEGDFNVGLSVPR